MANYLKFPLRHSDAGGVRGRRVRIGKGGAGQHSLIVYKGLAKAVRRESELAICHWWGVRTSTVRKWRRALGVGRMTEGTGQLHRGYIAEYGDDMRALGVHKARDPERCRKTTQARRANPPPLFVVLTPRSPGGQQRE